MISLSGAVSVIVYIIVGGIIFMLLKWLIDSSPIPDKFKQIANWVLILLTVLVAIGLLVSLVGGPSVGPIFRQ